MDRQNSFDFMRFVAATLVVYSHSFPLLGVYSREPFARASGYITGGELGVAIFFAMSGYLVTASRQNTPNIFRFLLKRALRIFPALAAVVLLTIFILGPFVTTLPIAQYFQHHTTWEYLWNIALWIHYPLPGVFEDLPLAGSVNGSLWTLPIEALMYIAVAALGTMGLLKRAWTPWGIALLLGIFAYIQLNQTLGQIELWKVGKFKECVKFAIFFFCGAALQLFHRKIPWRAEIAVLLLIIWIASFKTPVGIYCMFLAVPYCTLYIARGKFAPLTRFGKYGDFSYGIYIYAFPIQQTLVHTQGTTLDPLQLFAMALRLKPGAACDTVPVISGGPQ